MAALPYIQLYPADYLADTQHLTAEEHGAYLLLIFNYWQRGLPLPDDDHRLGATTRTSPDQWLRIRPAIEEYFDIRDGLWVHDRIEQDLVRVHEKAQKASRAGKMSAKKRAENKEESNGRSTDVQHAQKDPFNHTYTDTDINNKRHCVESEDSTRANGKHFEKFWSHWPRKRNKKKAKDAFMRKKFTIQDVEELIADVEDRKRRDGQWKRGFIPHCSSYIAGERWEDDYAN